MRRGNLLPVALLSALGAAGLALGLLALQGIFVDERRQALAELSARREALGQYARESLSARLPPGTCS